MKPSKLILHLETKHPNHATKNKEFFRRHEGRPEAYLAGSFHQENRHHMKSYLKLPSKKTQTIGKMLATPCLLKTVKQHLGEASKANIRRISLPTILFRGAFQMCRKMWKTRW